MHFGLVSLDWERRCWADSAGAGPAVGNAGLAEWAVDDGEVLRAFLGGVTVSGKLRWSLLVGLMAGAWGLEALRLRRR